MEKNIDEKDVSILNIKFYKDIGFWVLTLGIITDKVDINNKIYLDMSKPIDKQSKIPNADIPTMMGRKTLEAKYLYIHPSEKLIIPIRHSNRTLNKRQIESFFINFLRTYKNSPYLISTKNEGVPSIEPSYGYVKNNTKNIKLREDVSIYFTINDIKNLEALKIKIAKEPHLIKEFIVEKTYRGQPSLLQLDGTFESTLESNVLKESPLFKRTDLVTQYVERVEGDLKENDPKFKETIERFYQELETDTSTINKVQVVYKNENKTTMLTGNTFVNKEIKVNKNKVGIITQDFLFTFYNNHHRELLKNLEDAKQLSKIEDA